MSDTEHHRIRIGQGVALIVLAAIADLITLIPIAGDIVGPVFWISVSIYFWKSGLGVMNVGRLVTSTVSLVAEMFPVIQELPTILVGMIIIIVLFFFEDKSGVHISSIIGGGKSPLNKTGVRATPPPIPLNQGGVRPPNGGLPGDGN